jgi:hypothetical protein
MQFVSIVKGDPVEMIASHKKLRVNMCVEALSEIAAEKFGFSVQIADNFLVIGREDNEVCVLSFIEKGLVVLRRNMCPDFILLLRVAVATMGELHEKEENDFTELQDILGQKIDFDSDANEEDTEEIVSCDPEEASREAIKRLFVGIISKDEMPQPRKAKEPTSEPIVEEEEESDEDSEWI